MDEITAAAPHQLMNPAMRQTWRDLTFLHWPYDPALVRPLVPSTLQLDLSEGAAWIGVAPFRIIGLSLPRGPSIPWLSNFAETNVRTYVTGPDGRRGVWFFSLDAARLPAVIAARAVYALPYFWSSMRVRRQGETVEYSSRRLAGPPARTDIAIRIGKSMASPSGLELFLTARFFLFAQRGARLLRVPVEHPPWPLRRASVVRLEQSLIQTAGLPNPQVAPVAHFSESIDVLAGWPEGVLA